MGPVEPAVSVVMAVHDGERYLRPAVESVLSQTRDDLELLAVDDGSTDSTADILAEYARDDTRVVIERVSHAGRSVALNHGCRAARGALIARLDADDIALPKRLELQLAFLESHPEVCLLGGAALLIDDEGREFGRDALPTSDAEIRATLEHSSAFYHSNVVFRRDAFEAAGRYRPAFEPAEDYDLWLRLSEQGQVANLPDFVGKYRYYPQQESVVLAEAQATRALAGKVSAEDRRAGRPDRFADVERIDADTLTEAGVEEAEITEAVARYAVWLAETLSSAGQSDGSSSLWELASARARDRSAPARLREDVEDAIRRNARRYESRGSHGST